MKPVSSHFLNLSIVDRQGFGVERVEQGRAEQEQGRVEQDLLFGRLKPVETGYNRELRCMDGTRQFLLNQIIDWVPNKSGQENVFQRNAYWFYGSPGIGKTSLAHSICASLHERTHLAGAFFCRRDDPNLSEPINILPTFIYKLAILFPPFRTIAAKHLRDDPNLTPESMKDSLFLDFIRSLPSHPEHALVFVIDALDECGDTQSRPRLLKALTDAAAQAPWLKIIITSRTEVDIQHFFDTLTQSSYLSYDLATDQDDLRAFARSQFDLDKDNTSTHGESSGLKALDVFQDVHKLEDRKHDGGRAGHVPAAGMNPRYPRVLGPPHTTILFSHHHGHNSTHGTSSVRVSGHSNPSVAQVQSSGFSPSGHRITLQAGDRIPSLHETGPAPFLDADGGPVFIGSASFGRSVHPCKIVPNVRSLEAFGILLHKYLMQLPQPCRISYACVEQTHRGRYDLLPFIPSAMEWVPTSGGRSPIRRHPIEVGYEEDGTLLYHAAARIDNVMVPGKTNPRLVRTLSWASQLECV